MDELESSHLSFFLHVDGAVEPGGVGGMEGQAPPSEREREGGPLNHQVPPGPYGAKHPGLECWALSWQGCWGPVRRMSGPFWADMVARMT